MDLKIFGNQEMDNEEYFNSCCDSLWEEELNRGVERIETIYKIFKIESNGGTPAEIIKDSDREEIKLFVAIDLAQIDLPMCKKRTGGYFTPTLEMCKQRWINLKLLNK